MEEQQGADESDLLRERAEVMKPLDIPPFYKSYVVTIQVSQQKRLQFSHFTLGFLFQMCLQL